MTREQAMREPVEWLQAILAADRRRRASLGFLILESAAAAFHGGETLRRVNKSLGSQIDE